MTEEAVWSSGDRLIAQSIDAPPSPPSPSYVLSLSGRRDLSRRRHETHDLNYCREQLQALSCELKQKSVNLREREGRISSLERDLMSRVRSSIDAGVTMVRTKIKAEYDGRLDKMEAVVHRYRTHVESVVLENNDLKEAVGKLELENKRLEQLCKRKDDEARRRKKREEVEVWRRSKEEAAGRGSQKEKERGRRGKEKEKEVEKEKEKERPKGNGGVTEGGPAGGSARKTAALLHQKLESSTKLSKTFEIALLNILSLLPSPTTALHSSHPHHKPTRESVTSNNMSSSGGGSGKPSIHSPADKLIAATLPGLLALLDKIEELRQPSKKLPVILAISSVTEDVNPSKPYTLVTKSVVLRAPASLARFLDDEDFNIRFESALVVVRLMVGEGEGALLEKAAEVSERDCKIV